MNISNDDDLFLKVAQELARKWVDEALWTKAYALENGDERKTKAHYIRLRVEQLKTTKSKTQQEIAQDTSEHSKNEQDYVVESSNKAKALAFVPATAWQRFWARSIDLLICTILVQIVPIKDELLSNIWLIFIVGFLLTGVVLVIYDGLLTSVFGATIGKMIAGIRVQKFDGIYPDFGLAHRRAFNVFVSGNWLYMGYPVLQLLLWPRLHKEFKKTGTTTWDEKAGTVVIQASLNKIRDLIVGIVGLICLCSTLLLVQLIKQQNKSYIREVATDQAKISGANGASTGSSNTGISDANDTQENKKTSTKPKKELFGYEKRAWSGNMFDQFDPESVIEKKAKERIPQMSNQRVWQAVKSWQMNYIQYFKDDPSPALYKAVDDVLEGLKDGKGVCVSSPVYISKEHAPPIMPDGGYMLRSDCDNER